MKPVLVCLLGMLLWLSALPVQGDEYRPAYLEIIQTEPELYEVLWKVPAAGTSRLSLDLRFSEDVEYVLPPRPSLIGAAYIERSTITRQGGLAGASINIDGLVSIATDVLVRIERLDGSEELVRLTSANDSFVVGDTPGRSEIATSYVRFGMEHIWEGKDHLLFVACLVFIARTWRRILVTITGFTVAHSITLTLASLGMISMPIAPIEAIIALSIVFLAREIVRNKQDTLTWRFPVAVSTSFGLLHGFGFASALGELGLPQTDIPLALLAFNVGVEIGQIAFVALLIAVVWSISAIYAQLQKLWLGEAATRADHMRWLTALQVPLAYGIGAITMLWTIERIYSFWV